MSIIHDALKKVQSKMGGVSINPEDIVEVLPSEKAKSTDKPKGFNLRSFLIIFFCILLIAACLFFGYSQLNKNKPELLSKINLPSSIEIQKNIEKAIEQSPLATFMPKKVAPTPTTIPLAQIIIPETVNPPISTSETPTFAEPIKNSPTITTPSVSEEMVLNIQGVMTDPRGNVVLINNNVYAEGEVVNKIKLIHITMQEITIEHNGKQQIIPVKK